MAIKYLFPIVTTFVLTACASHSSTTSNITAAPETSVAIKAFTDVCLKTAPSFANAKKEAVAYGISEDTGFTQDTSMGMQVKSNKECVITTEK